MKARKILVSLAALALVAAISIGGTLAYLTSTDKVENTFTVGNVSITLDEAKVNADGAKLYVPAGETETDDFQNYTTTAEGNTPAKRVKANDYHLLPGHTYVKDPTVTVRAGSEPSYVKMTVTFSKANELDAIFAPNGANLTSIFNGYDGANWIDKGNTKDATANTRTYEFWYKNIVSASDVDVALDALFDSITVPSSITKEQLATIEDMTITVNAYAIQADGMEDATDAWAKFPNA